MLGSTSAAYLLNLNGPVRLGGMSLFDVTTRSLVHFVEQHQDAVIAAETAVP